jgi:hypothetical protein
MMVALMITPPITTSAISGLWTQFNTASVHAKAGPRTALGLGLGVVHEQGSHVNTIQDQPASQPKTSGQNSVSAEGARSLNPSDKSVDMSTQSPVDLLVFTVITSTVTYSTEYYEGLPIPLPSDHVAWHQSLAGSWSPISRFSKTPSSVSTPMETSSEPPDLMHDQGTHSKCPASTESIQSQITEAIKPSPVPLDSNEEVRHLNHTQKSPHPSMKSCHLELGAYIDSGRLYHAYRATLTTVYHHDETPSSTIPVVAKYVNLNEFAKPLKRKNQKPTGDYDRAEAHKAMLHEVNVLKQLFANSATRHIIPQFHGLLFDGEETRSRFWVLTEDCGRRANLADTQIQYVFDFTSC